MQSFIHKEYFDKGDVITTDIIKFKKTVILPIEQPQQIYTIKHNQYKD